MPRLVSAAGWLCGPSFAILGGGGGVIKAMIIVRMHACMHAVMISPVRTEACESELRMSTRSQTRGTAPVTIPLTFLSRKQVSGSRGGAAETERSFYECLITKGGG